MRPPAQHGLFSNPLASITPGCGTTRSPSIKMALITSGSVRLFRSKLAKRGLPTSGLKEVIDLYAISLVARAFSIRTQRDGRTLI